MSKPIRGRNTDQASPSAEVAGFDSLSELALDLRWSWNHAADDVWQQLDPALWELTHNPWIVLQTVSRSQVEQLSADPVSISASMNSSRPKTRHRLHQPGSSKTIRSRP